MMDVLILRVYESILLHFTGALLPGGPTTEILEMGGINGVERRFHSR